MKAVLALFLLLALPARAEFRCVAELRAGFAEQAAAGAITGPAVALCRSLADQLAGPAEAARLILLAPDSGLGLPPAEVAFLSDAMVAERRVSGDVRMGPAVFHDPISVLVPQRSTIRQPSELGGRLVCLMIGSDGQLALEQMLAHLSPAPIRVGFREADELTDAYNVGRCEAAIGLQTDLLDMQTRRGINQLQSRILRQSVGDAPIRLAVPKASPIRVETVRLP